MQFEFSISLTTTSTLSALRLSVLEGLKRQSDKVIAPLSHLAVELLCDFARPDEVLLPVEEGVGQVRCFYQQAPHGLRVFFPLRRAEFRAVSQNLRRPPHLPGASLVETKQTLSRSQSRRRQSDHRYPRSQGLAERTGKT